MMDKRKGRTHMLVRIVILHFASIAVASGRVGADRLPTTLMYNPSHGWLISKTKLL